MCTMSGTIKEKKEKKKKEKRREYEEDDFLGKRDRPFVDFSSLFDIATPHHIESLRKSN